MAPSEKHIRGWDRGRAKNSLAGIALIPYGNSAGLGLVERTHLSLVLPRWWVVWIAIVSVWWVELGWVKKDLARPAVFPQPLLSRVACFSGESISVVTVYGNRTCDLCRLLHHNYVPNCV